MKTAIHTIPLDQYLVSCCEIAREAGALIMRHFIDGTTHRQKEDHSPVTDADIEANQLIINHLSRISSHIPIIAEEDDALPTEASQLFWLVDPLDGTRSFIRGEPEFTVNIGLIHQGNPVLGVIYAPPQETLYYAIPSRGAWKQEGSSAPVLIHTRSPAPDGLVVVRSRSHPSPNTASYLEKLKVKDIIPGSSSVKFCMVAEGSADLYPRLGRTMEWDTAAGHAILLAAGGRVLDTHGVPLAYGKPGFENPHFIAHGK
jgi:3'(2'), 5'-bisphosphate nucleotidase